MEKLCYSIPEFAQALSVSPRTVSRWIAGGKIKVIRLSESKMGRARILAEELDRIKREWAQGHGDEA